MSELDKAEFQRLEVAVRAVERLLNQGNVSLALAAFHNSGQSRLNTLQSEGLLFGEDDTKKKEKSANLEIAAIVASEHRLSASEKSSFASLLSNSHFKREHFTEMETFYDHSWEKLSERGKSHLSYRVWEGIREEEYSFSELPQTVRDKESQMLYDKLTNLERTSPSLAAIPKQDSEEFVQEYRSGRHQNAHEILERPSFREHVAKSPEPEILAAAVSQAEAKVISTREPDSPPEFDLDGIDIDSLPDLSETESPSMPELPQSEPNGVKTR